MSKNNLVYGTIIVLAVSIITKIVAFLVEAIIAYYVGTSKAADAYSLVIGFNDVVSPILTIGIWKVFLPVYKKKMTLEDVGVADAFANQCLTFFLIVSLIFTAFVFFGADSIVTIMGPGLDYETSNISIQLLKISSPFYLFLLASGIIAAMLQCHDKFFGSQIRELATHLPKLVMALFFFKYFGIESVAIGIALGGLVRLLIQLPFINWGFNFKFDFKFKTGEIKDLTIKLPSAVITAGVLQLNTLIDKIIASLTVPGAIAALGYGYKLINVFSGMITMGISTVLYPRMAHLAAIKDSIALSSLIEKVITLVCGLILPITVGCVIFSQDIVKVVYMRGAFDVTSAELVAKIFACYSLGMVFLGLKDILSNVIYSFGNTRLPLFISIFAIILNLILNIFFVKYIGVSGLALSTSISAAVNTIMLLLGIERYVHIDYKKISIEMVKIVFSCIIAFGIPALILRNNISYDVVIIKIGMNVLLYIVSMILLKSELYSWCKKLLNKC